MTPNIDEDTYDEVKDELPMLEFFDQITREERNAKTHITEIIAFLYSVANSNTELTIDAIKILIKLNKKGE